MNRSCFFITSEAPKRNRLFPHSSRNLGDKTGEAETGLISYPSRTKWGLRSRAVRSIAARYSNYTTSEGNVKKNLTWNPCLSRDNWHLYCLRDDHMEWEIVIHETIIFVLCVEGIPIGTSDMLFVLLTSLATEPRFSFRSPNPQTNPKTKEKLETEKIPQKDHQEHSDENS